MNRILAIGDIHGCAVALRTLLEAVKPTVTDTVVLLGDLVDRGPQTREVIDQLSELAQRLKLILILGNHEEMLRDAITGRGLWNAWLENGGQATLDSYGGNADNIPAEHWRLLTSARQYWESDSEIFVHASLEQDVTLCNQSREFLRWKHLGGMETPHRSGKRVICGHTAQRDGMPLVFNGWVCIDTHACGGGYLTCLDVASNHVVQASERGVVREFPLAKYGAPHV